MWIEDIAILNCQLGKIICQMLRIFDMTFSLAYHWWQDFSQRFWCLVRSWSHIYNWSDWVTLFVGFGGAINTRLSAVVLITINFVLFLLVSETFQQA